jgi:hypothetical protein
MNSVPPPGGFLRISLVRVVSLKLRLQSTKPTSELIAAVPQEGAGLNIPMFLHLCNRQHQLDHRVTPSPEFHLLYKHIHLPPNKHGYELMITYLAL